MSEPSEQSMSIAQFQAHIKERYYATDLARGTPPTFMWFIEEVGELSTALQNVKKTGPKAEAQMEAYRANLEEEFADVFAWLCTLANINDVDLSEAIKKKYLTGKGPEGTK